MASTDMSYAAAWCSLVIVRIANVLNRFIYTLTEWICRFANTVLQEYLSKLETATSTEIHFQRRRKRQLPKVDKSMPRQRGVNCAESSGVKQNEQRAETSEFRMITKTYHVDINELLYTSLVESSLPNIYMPLPKVAICDLKKAENVTLSLEFPESSNKNRSSDRSDKILNKVDVSNDLKRNDQNEHRSMHVENGKLSENIADVEAVLSPADVKAVPSPVVVEAALTPAEATALHSALQGVSAQTETFVETSSPQLKDLQKSSTDDVPLQTCVSGGKHGVYSENISGFNENLKYVDESCVKEGNNLKALAKISDGSSSAGTSDTFDNKVTPSNQSNKDLEINNALSLDDKQPRQSKGKRNDLAKNLKEFYKHEVPNINEFAVNETKLDTSSTEISRHIVDIVVKKEAKLKYWIEKHYKEDMITDINLVNYINHRCKILRRHLNEPLCISSHGPWYPVLSPVKQYVPKKYQRKYSKKATSAFKRAEKSHIEPSTSISVVKFEGQKGKTIDNVVKNALNKEKYNITNTEMKSTDSIDKTTNITNEKKKLFDSTLLTEKDPLLHETNPILKDCLKADTTPGNFELGKNLDKIELDDSDIGDVVEKEVKLKSWNEIYHVKEDMVIDINRVNYINRRSKELRRHENELVCTSSSSDSSPDISPVKQPDSKVH